MVSYKFGIIISDSAWCSFGSKPFPEPMMIYCQSHLPEQTSVKLGSTQHISLTHWPLGDLDAILELQFSILFCGLLSSYCLIIMPWDECHGTSLMTSQGRCCRQATSHYLNQCWPSSMSPYGITRPQWVKHKCQPFCSAPNVPPIF